MTGLELEHFKQLLTTTLERMEQPFRKRDEIAIENAPDDIDRVQGAVERELAIRNLDRESGLLRKVRAALLRVQDGSFGTCMHCDEEISPKRLKAVPWAPFCIKCQELADRHEFEASEALDEFLADAA